MPKKLTSEEINKRIMEKRNDIIYFDDSTYKNVDTKAKFIHKIYGEWWQYPYAVMKGNLHPEDAKIKTVMAHTIPLETIIERIKKVHGDLVILDVETYKGTQLKATFIDAQYGTFSAKVNSVLRGSGHPDRGRRKTAEKNTLSMQEIKERLPIFIKIVEETFLSLETECSFIDSEYGLYITKPIYILRGGGKHQKRKSKDLAERQRTSLSDINNILEKNNPGIKIIYDTYTNICESATFIDPEYGEWSGIAKNVFNGSGHPNRELEKIKKTCLKKYGVDSASKNRDVFLKITRSSHKTTVKFHWKTKQELLCKASYECAVVEYLNANKINYEWQPKMFTMPNGRGYIPDLYLTDQDIWVEIKGWMRPVGKEKWDWFKTIYPTAELWNKEKLKSMRII